jgi:hypothetical protein
MSSVVFVRIVVRCGKKQGQYRPDGSAYWFRMTVADAERALKNGIAHIGAVENCKIVQG